MKSKEKITRSIGTPLTRDQLKLIHGGRAYECHCWSPAGDLSWGCIDLNSCMNVGDSQCSGSSYSCDAVAS